MYPFLVDRLDSVVLRKPHKQLKKVILFFSISQQMDLASNYKGKRESISYLW